MKVKVLQENLTKALTAIAPIITPRGQLPILSYILLSGEETKLKLTGTNLQTSIVFEVPAKVIKKGEVVVPGRIFAEFISSLRAEKIILQGKEKNIEVLGKKIKSFFNVLPAKDFPQVPTIQKDKEAIKIKGKKIKNALSSVVFAASSDETRPVLTGVYFLFEEKKLKLVATDGFRLSCRQIKLEREEKRKEMVIPSASLAEALRLIDEEGVVQFFWDKKENQVIFAQKEIILSSRLIEGEFPPFEKIIPQSFVREVSLGTQVFLQAVKMAAIFARGSTNMIKLKLEKGKLRIFAENPQVGQHEEEVSIEGEGEEIEIAFNFRFLLDFLNSCKKEEFLLKISGPETAAVFVPVGKTSYFHLVMPIRLREET